MKKVLNILKLRNKLLIILICIVGIFFFTIVLYYQTKPISDNGKYTLGFTEGYTAKGIKYHFYVDKTKYEGEGRESLHLNVFAKNAIYYVAYAEKNPSNNYILFHRPYQGKSTALDTMTRVYKEDLELLSLWGVKQLFE
ncbi:MAG: hypothetical protein CMO01_13285 [Thalassobius sp.]|nr:hypothetical protein [Thalassovita sp.]